VIENDASSMAVAAPKRLLTPLTATTGEFIRAPQGLRKRKTRS
jgi:hypothetical protein